MATISANGGAERYWRNGATGMRLVLCRNGRFLVNRGSGWREARQAYTVAGIARDAAWRSDTGSAASAAVTRTTRQARRLVKHKQIG